MRYGKTDTETALTKEEVSLTVPSSRRLGRPCRATRGGSRVGREYREGGENVGKSFHCRFRGKESVRESKQV